VIASLALLGRIGLFAARIVQAAFTGRVPLRDLATHLHTVVIRCLGPVLAVVFPFGMVMALQGLQIFRMYGSQRLLSPFVAAAIVRELSPVMTSVLVAAQGGSSVAAELGAMRIKEELDATDVMAVDSVAFHAAPRAHQGAGTPLFYLSFFRSFLPVGRGAACCGSALQERALKTSIARAPPTIMSRHRIWPVVKLNGVNLITGLSMGTKVRGYPRPLYPIPLSGWRVNSMKNRTMP
jgi:ABC-type transporter Mla maintaining outer membrane lipid asymmetry permease subunit MlaE